MTPATETTVTKRSDVETIGSGELALRIPRALLDPRREDLPASADGLVAVRLEHRQGQLTRLLPLDPASQAAALLPLALTPLAEPHAHLDKIGTWPSFPNPAGTMAGALAANIQEHRQRTAEGVQRRAAAALERGWRLGLRAIRSHVDADGPVGAMSWQVLQQLAAQWRDRLELQLVAMAPVGLWATEAGRRQAAEVARQGGLLGGVVGPPYGLAGQAERDALAALLRLADEHGCGVDLHIDEAEDHPGRGLQLLLELLEQLRCPVPITCSHASSMGLLAERRCRALAERLARWPITVVALPSTNQWLLGRHPDRTPCRRPLAPIRQLQQAGVPVALGSDNAQDPWFPGGELDPLETLRLAVPAAQLDPWRRQDLALLTSAPARLLGLAWDGVLREGGPLELVVTAAADWSELLARNPERRVLRQGQWLPPPEPPPLRQALERLASG